MPAFIPALWSLLLEAQNSQAGIPQALINEKEEMRRARAGNMWALDEQDCRAHLYGFWSNDWGNFRGGSRSVNMAKAEAEGAVLTVAGVDKVGDLT